MNAETQAIVNCARCGVRCRKNPGSNDARLLKYTQSDFGLCINCGVTAFLQSLDVIASPGRNAKQFDPECLRLPHVQKQFETIMAAGKSDARPDEIDWMKIITYWSLPFSQHHP
jgi:hypothetical protein